MKTIDDKPVDIANGAALAAFLAAGIGAFGVGFVVVLNAAGLFPVPALYGPAGGVSSRTAVAAVVWLIGWVVLHRRWTHRQLDPRRIYAATLTLIAVGTVLCFPPVWKVFG